MRLNPGSLPIGSKSFFRLRLFHRVGQREPGAKLAFGGPAAGLELGCGTQELLGVGLIGLGQLQAQIQVRFEDVGLGSNGVAIGGDGIVEFSQRVLHEPEIEPGDVIGRVMIQHFAQQRFSGRVVLFLNGIFRLGQFLRCRTLDGNLDVPDGSR